MKDEGGRLVSGAQVVLYSESWSRVGERTTNSAGVAQWTGLSAATYYVEAYKGGEFWSAGSASVGSGGSVSTTLDRRAPFLDSLTLTERGDGDGTIELGESVTISPGVYNGEGRPISTQVRIRTDRDKSASWDQEAWRGPVDIGARNVGWFGTDFQPAAAGTYYVHIRVEALYSTSYALTDDSGWTASFTVANPPPTNGNLKATVIDEGGAPVAGAQVVLYSESWSRLGEKITGADGAATWTELDPATYLLEAYDDGAFWGGRSVTISPGKTTGLTLDRKAPRLDGITITELGDGDGTIEPGETITISPAVYNGEAREISTQVRIRADRDMSAVWDFETWRGPVGVASGQKAWFGADFTPTAAGTYRVHVRVEALYSSSYALTDDAGWVASFVVEDTRPAAGDLKVVVLDATGAQAPGATVVRYTDAWVPLDERTTGADGAATWTGLAPATYMLEAYSSGAFWRGGSATVAHGATSTVTLARAAPHYRLATYAERGDGDGIIQLGETVTVSPAVRNGEKRVVSTQARIRIDRDAAPPWDLEVWRGPVDAPAREDAWFGVDYTPTGPGDYRLQVRVESLYASRYVLTDETAWMSGFTVIDASAGNGSLTAAVSDQAGAPVPGATVARYSGAWELLDQRTTGVDGVASWTGIEAGTYRVEAYVEGAFWGGADATVASGGSASTNLDRKAPYLDGVAVDEDGEGDGNIEPGETVVVRPSVRHAEAGPVSTQVRIRVDRDRVAPWDLDALKGPVQAGPDAPTWFGVDFAPAAEGTYHVQVVVEADYGRGAVLTDDAGWTESFVVGEAPQDVGTLRVLVHDTAGLAVAGSTVVRYDTAWRRLDERVTGDDGAATWADVPAGPVRLEAYVGGAFWGGSEASVAAGGTTTHELHRRAPRLAETTVTEHGDGDGRIAPGETVTISLGVRHGETAPVEARVRILADRDLAPPWDLDVERGPVEVPVGDAGWFGADFAPAAAGTYQVRVMVESRYGDGFTLTDAAGWGESFVVHADTASGDLRVLVQDLAGAPVPGATVVRYDGGWTRLDEHTTGLDGAAEWTALATASYHLEAYVEGEFWGGTSSSVTAGAVANKVIDRRAPWLRGVAVTERGDGDGTIDLGEEVRIDVDVHNGEGSPILTQVALRIDRDRAEPWDGALLQGPAHVFAREDGQFGAGFTPTVAGTYQVHVRIEAKYAQEFALTDDAGWATTFTVVEPDASADPVRVLPLFPEVRAARGSQAYLWVDASGPDGDPWADGWLRISSTQLGRAYESRETSQPGRYVFTIRVPDAVLDVDDFRVLEARRGGNVVPTEGFTARLVSTPVQAEHAITLTGGAGGEWAGAHVDGGLAQGLDLIFEDGLVNGAGARARAWAKGGWEGGAGLKIGKAGGAYVEGHATLTLAGMRDIVTRGWSEEAAKREITFAVTNAVLGAVSLATAPWGPPAGAARAAAYRDWEGGPYVVRGETGSGVELVAEVGGGARVGTLTPVPGRLPSGEGFDDRIRFGLSASGELAPKVRLWTFVDGSVEVSFSSERVLHAGVRLPCLIGPHGGGARSVDLAFRWVDLPAFARTLRGEGVSGVTWTYVQEEEVDVGVSRRSPDAPAARREGCDPFGVEGAALGGGTGTRFEIGGTLRGGAQVAREILSALTGSTVAKSTDRLVAASDGPIRYALRPVASAEAGGELDLNVLGFGAEATLAFDRVTTYLAEEGVWLDGAPVPIWRLPGEYRPPPVGDLLRPFYDRSYFEEVRQRGLGIVTHSPVHLLVTDGAGRRVGIDADGIRREEIPGAYYAPGAEEILYLPEGEYAIEVFGDANDTYDIEFARYRGNETNVLEFKNVVATAGSRDRIELGGSVAFVPDRAVDVEIVAERRIQEGDATRVVTANLGVLPTEALGRAEVEVRAWSELETPETSVVLSKTLGRGTAFFAPRSDGVVVRYVTPVDAPPIAVAPPDERPPAPEPAGSGERPSLVTPSPGVPPHATTAPTSGAPPPASPPDSSPSTPSLEHHTPFPGALAVAALAVAVSLARRRRG